MFLKKVRIVYLFVKVICTVLLFSRVPANVNITLIMLPLSVT